MHTARGFGRIVFLGLIAVMFSHSAQLGTTRPGSLEWYAEMAKKKGETSITIEAPRGIHERITSLDQALSTYEVIVGTPVAAATQLADADHLYTWYKIKTLEELITHPNPEVPVVSLPEALLPVKPGEVVIRIPEGTLTIDGVKITVTDRDLHLLTVDAKYVLFLSPDSSGRFAYLRSGSNAIFALSADNRMTPFIESRTSMKDDLDISTGGSLASLREFAKRKASDRTPKN